LHVQVGAEGELHRGWRVMLTVLDCPTVSEQLADAVARDAVSLGKLGRSLLFYPLVGLVLGRSCCTAVNASAGRYAA
jgi:hypothetical protein